MVTPTLVLGRVPEAGRRGPHPRAESELTQVQGESVPVVHRLLREAQEQAARERVGTGAGGSGMGGVGGTTPAACDLTVSPGDSFDTAFSQLSAGQTLCLNDGVYQQAMDVPDAMHVRAVNDGMAELDGMGQLGIEWSGGVLTLGGSDSSARGLKVYRGGQLADACTLGGSNNVLRAVSCSHGGSHKHKLPLKITGSDHLVEDSWFYGEGRYVVQCFQGDNITVRRNVIRWDGTVAGEPDEPNAVMSNYSCSDMIWENNVSLDYGAPATHMVHCGDICMSTVENEPNTNVGYFGNMVVNHDPSTGNNKAFRADQKGAAPSNNITIQDFYVRDVGLAVAVNPIYENVSVGDCTLVDVPSGGSVDGQAVVCNGMADLRVRYQDGVKTTLPLWPWPNEQLIKRDLCASGERQSDWCLTNQSLSEYLGVSP